MAAVEGCHSDAPPRKMAARRQLWLGVFRPCATFKLMLCASLAPAAGEEQRWYKAHRFWPVWDTRRCLPPSSLMGWMRCPQSCVVVLGFSYPVFLLSASPFTRARPVSPSEGAPASSRSLSLLFFTGVMPNKSLVCLCFCFAEDPRIGTRSLTTWPARETPSQVVCGLWIVPGTGGGPDANNFNGGDFGECFREGMP